MPANVNFLNRVMVTMGEEFPGMTFREIPLFTDPSKLESGTCYVDVDEMNTPGALEGRTVPETFDFNVTLMPVWDVGKEYTDDGDPPTLSDFRSIVEHMIGHLKEREWEGTGIVLEIDAYQMAVGDPMHPTHIAWRISFHIDVLMDLDEVWYYPPNVIPARVRSITHTVRLVE